MAVELGMGGDLTRFGDEERVEAVSHWISRSLDGLRGYGTVQRGSVLKYKSVRGDLVG